MKLLFLVMLVLISSKVFSASKVHELQNDELIKKNAYAIISTRVLDKFKLTAEEFEFLRCQNGTSNDGRGGRRYLPNVFTEAGVAMLSSVLTSERAALVNVSIIRTFIRLRSFLAMESQFQERVTKLEQGTNKLFKIVFERLDSVEELTVTKVPVKRKRIGLK